MSQLLATDPHEDKWNKLAVSSRTEDWKSINIEEKLSEYVQHSKEHFNVNTSYQHQTLKEISRQNEQLKQFNDRIMRQFDEIQRSKWINPGTKYPLTKDAYTSNYVISPDQISPILKSCDDRIKSLEEEMDLRERDLVKLAGMIDLLIDENKYLRDHIAFKNKDLTKILETIGLNDSEAVNDLKHRLGMLSEENNMLLGHLEELKQLRDNFERINHERTNELEEERRAYQDARRSLEEALVREELLTNYKQVTEPKLREAHNRIQEMEAEIQDIVEELHNTKNQCVLATNQAQQYKKNFEELDGKKALEVDKLIQEINHLQNEKKEWKKILDNKDKAIQQHIEETRKVRRDNEQTKLELEEALQNMGELKNEIANERQAAEFASRREKEAKAKNEDLQEEIQRLKDKIKKIEENSTKNIDSVREEYDQSIQKYEKKIEKAKQKKKEAVKEKEDEINSLNQQIIDMKKALAKVRQERDDYQRKSEDLERYANEISHRDNVINELQEKITALTDELFHERTKVQELEGLYSQEK